MHFLRRLIIFTLIKTSITIVIIILADRFIENATAGRVFNSTASIPTNKVGLFLSTGKTSKSTELNEINQSRVMAAKDLFETGKIEYIFVIAETNLKGFDNSSKIKNSLISSGIPLENVIIDYTNFKDEESILSCHKLLGERNLTIISAPKHNQRLIYMADKHGLQAIGYNIYKRKKSVGLKEDIDEYLARTKIFLDSLFKHDYESETVIQC